MSSLSVVFAGTPQFAVPALQALLTSRHRVAAVYTQPDRPAGRGRQLAMSPVKQCALQHQLSVCQPPSLKDPQAQQMLADWSADVMVVVAYGLLLPEPVLRTPRLGCVNIHASLLPRWRGAAPIQRAIQAGDSNTGVSIMQMDVGLDTGPVLLESVTAIGARENAAGLHDRLAVMGAQSLLEALNMMAAGFITGHAQPEQGAVYAAKLRKEEAVIDWTASATVIDRQVRAFNPWPIAQTTLHGEQLRIWEAEPLERVSESAPGTVVGQSSAGIEVATGQGVLRLTQVQAAGRKAMSAADFLKAQRLTDVVLGQ